MGNSNDSKSSSSGIGFISLLAVAFIVLKLCKVINWPWIWVLSPIWGGIILWVIVFVILVCVFHRFLK